MAKITLSKETVRKLSGIELKRAFGGGSVPACCDTFVSACYSPLTCIHTDIDCHTLEACETSDTCDTCATCKGHTCGRQC